MPEQWPETQPQRLRAAREATWQGASSPAVTGNCDRAAQSRGARLTPAAHCVLATRHDIFALLVFTRNHFKFDGCVTHSMVSLRKNRDNR